MSLSNGTLPPRDSDPDASSFPLLSLPASPGQRDKTIRFHKFTIQRNKRTSISHPTPTIQKSGKWFCEEIKVGPSAS